MDPHEIVERTISPDSEIHLVGNRRIRDRLPRSLRLGLLAAVAVLYYWLSR